MNTYRVKFQEISSVIIVSLILCKDILCILHTVDVLIKQQTFLESFVLVISWITYETLKLKSMFLLHRRAHHEVLVGVACRFVWKNDLIWFKVLATLRTWKWHNIKLFVSQSNKFSTISCFLCLLDLVYLDEKIGEEMRGGSCCV